MAGVERRMRMTTINGSWLESSGPTVFGIFLSVQDCGARSLGQVKDVLFV